MLRRPRSITLVAWVFIAAGVAGLLNDWWPLFTADRAQQLAKLKADGVRDLGPAWTLRALAVVGGAGLLAGRNWARWLLLAWMIFHVGISAFHTLTEVLLHLAIFTPLTYLMFRRPMESYFLPDKVGR